MRDLGGSWLNCPEGSRSAATETAHCDEWRADVRFCGGSAGMELVQVEWRRLNTESPDDDEQAAKLWARRGGVEWELGVVVITSTA
jgi:hypothetical protein